MQLELGLLAGIILVTGITIWQTISVRRTMASLEARLGRQADALTLLTETSDSGFALIARELERATTAPVKAARKPSTRRMTTAARKGRSIAEIAAAEGLSESEVHLRLHIAGQSATGA